MGEALHEHDLSGLRENFSPRAKWRSAIDAVRAAGRISALAHGQLRTVETEESLRSESSGGWDSSRPGTSLRGGATTSDEEEASKGAEEEGIGDEWEVRPRRHPPSSSLSSQPQPQKAEEHHFPEDAKVAGVSIHEGHAHVVPQGAGEIEAKASSKVDKGQMNDSDEEMHIPGAYIWDKIKDKLK